MITAAEFVNVDFSDSDAEKERLVTLISSLPTYTQTVRTSLAEEFLRIIGDANESFGRRVQAASMLAYQTKRLGIRGSTPMAQAVCNVLEREFARLSIKHSPQTAQAQEVGRIRNLDGPERLWVGHLVAAALSIDYMTAKVSVKRIAELLADEDASIRIGQIMQAAERAQDK
jgi:hypothetical protein